MLHAILGGAATTTPTLYFDSVQGVRGNMEAGFAGEEVEEEEEVVDSSQQGSGETSFPSSRDLFITLDLDPVPPEPTQGGLLDFEGREGISAAYVSPSQRLAKIRRWKKHTRNEMFSDLMLSSHTDRAQQNTWRQTISECRKIQYDREERWWAEDGRWRWLPERRQESMLRLLEDQTHMLQRMVELQERQQEYRPPLQPLCNKPPSSPISIASSPRRPRTRWGGLRPPSHFTP
nr:uncharacterized protein LOC125642420 [Caretta caretta]